MVKIKTCKLTVQHAAVLKSSVCVCVCEALSTRLLITFGAQEDTLGSALTAGAAQGS